MAKFRKLFISKCFRKHGVFHTSESEDVFGISAEAAVSVPLQLSLDFKLIFSLNCFKAPFFISCASDLSPFNRAVLIHKFKAFSVRFVA